MRVFGINPRDLIGRLWPRHFQVIDEINWNAKLLAWCKEHRGVPTFPVRDKYFDYLSAQIGQEPITYLEFGVHQGASIRRWAELNQHKESRFFGFDSFEGLPEDWSYGKTCKAGEFDVQGSAPLIDDARVSFVKGWFQKTLARFLKSFQPKGRLVIHLDADLYSSTLYVLTKLDPVLPPGSILMFDEICIAAHEFRAWTDYLSAYGRDYEVLAGVRTTERYFYRVAIRIG